MEGPQFSTRAESELYRSWGCDVIGMTNLPEAQLAREAELCYASVAMVTDYDCWHPQEADVEAAQAANVEDANPIRFPYDHPRDGMRYRFSIAPGGETTIAWSDGVTEHDVQLPIEALRYAATTRAAYDDARQNTVIAAARVKEAEAAITAAAAELQLAEIDLAHAEVRAPYSGIVTQRLTEAGAYVQTGQAIVRMITDVSLEIEADVPYERLSGLVVGTTVSLELGDGTKHRAVVRAVVASSKAGRGRESS